MTLRFTFDPELDNKDVYLIICFESKKNEFSLSIIYMYNPIPAFIHRIRNEEVLLIISLL